MLSFLLLVELSGRLGDAYALPMLLLRVGVPLGMLVYFGIRGEFPEMHFSFHKMTLIDLCVGVGLAVMWIAPYILFPSIRPDPDAGTFDPHLAGLAWAPAMLILRMVGYAVVTPVMEELFMRSFGDSCCRSLFQRR